MLPKLVSVLPEQRSLLILLSLGASLALSISFAIAQQPPTAEAAISVNAGIVLRATLSDGQTIELRAREVSLKFPSGGELNVNEHGAIPAPASPVRVAVVPVPAEAQPVRPEQPPAFSLPGFALTGAATRGLAVAAPLHYSDTLALLTDDKGIALVAFECPAKNKPDVSTTSECVSYRFRYLPKDGKEVSGDGILYERYLHEADNSVTNDHGKLRLIAGHFDLEWSQGDTQMGWLYYKPEEVRVEIVNAREFETLALDRFRR